MLKSSRLFQRLAAEVRRRKVFRVVAVYAVVAWVLLQLAEISFEPLGYPDWALRALIISAIVGFPVAFILAWVIDIRPEGLIFDLPLLGSDTNEPRQRKKYDLVFASSLIAILAGGSYYLVNLLLNASPDIEPKQVNTMEADNSIAVLAFENFDGIDKTDYFAAGLADEILHLLAGVAELDVSSRTSSFQFRGKQIDPRDVAKRLGVQHVLEGSARQQNDQISVAARLIDGDSGNYQWRQSYDRELADIFQIQRDIAKSVVDELKIVLSINSEAHLGQQATQSTDAYLLYLQGAGRLRSSLDADVMRDASQQFQQAISIDRNFAKAYSGICEAHLRLYEINKSTADFEVAESACENSSLLDPGLSSDVSLALGKLYGDRGWFERAENQLNKAITLNPEPIDAYLEMSRVRMSQGRPDEAEALLIKAHDLKPGYWATHEALASYYYRNDRYSEAIKEYKEAIELAPNIATSYAALGAAHWMHGEHNEAIKAYQSSLDLKPSRQAHTNIGLLHYYAGRFEEAIKNQQKALEFAPNDFRVWGRIAEAYYFEPNLEKAKEAFLRATDLAEKNLLVNNKAWRTEALMATYLAYLGRGEQAELAAVRSIDLSNGNAEAIYYQAMVFELLDKPNKALTTVKQAIKIDPSYQQLIEGEPALAELRKRLSNNSTAEPE